MRAINHALTGAAIGLSVGNPAVSLPASFFSHFICDIIPHYGAAKGEGDLTTRSFKLGLLADAFACVLLVMILFIAKPQNWLAACFCAFLATSPDFLWFRAYRRSNSGKPPKRNDLEILLARIQWFERPAGIWIELVWLVVFSYFVYTFIR